MSDSQNSMFVSYFHQPDQARCHNDSPYANVLELKSLHESQVTELAFTCLKLTIETLEQGEICSELIIKTLERRHWRCAGLEGS